jgi:hypothetical protein
MLVTGCAGLWLVAYLACVIFDEKAWAGWDGVVHSSVSAVVCLVPTAVTLLWCDLVLGKSPEQQLAAVLGGTGVRMAFVVGVAMVLYYNVEQFHSSYFWLWIIGFYLATLTVEMVLVVRRQSELEEAPHSKTHA